MDFFRCDICNTYYVSKNEDEEYNIKFHIILHNGFTQEDFIRDIDKEDN